MGRNFERSMRINSAKLRKKGDVLKENICKNTNKILPECLEKRVEKLMEDGDTFLINQLQAVGKRGYQFALEGMSTAYGIDFDPDQVFHPDFKIEELQSKETKPL